MEADRPLRIVVLASEVTPYAKTGGLADVAGALSDALAERGHDVHVIMPLHGRVNRTKWRIVPEGFSVDSWLPGERATFEVFSAPRHAGRARVWMLAHHTFDRAELYGDRYGDFGDNHRRFALFCRAALDLAKRVAPYPDVVQLHDWQTGLAALELKANDVPHPPELVNARVAMAIHNLAYTGSFSAEALDETGVSRAHFRPDELEFYGRASLLKAGLVFADALTTVSPRYAREIQAPAFGSGLDGLLRARSGQLAGILNGIDVNEWNPATDPHLAARYDAAHMDGKAVCKDELQQELGLERNPDKLVFGVVSRLAWQKGIDLAAELAESIVYRGGQIAVLGSGEEGLEGWLTDLSHRFPGQIAARLGFDEPLSHRIVAGSDAFLMPSRYEPCGLTQMYGLRYGTVPVVRAVGGLDDTVEELDSVLATGTGFKFGAATASALWAAVERAFEAWGQRDVWNALRGRGMVRDFSWNASAATYEALFRALARTGTVPVERPADERPSAS